jgi:hypothetical protein
MVKTRFRPQTNGFAFVNSWTFDQDENDKMKQTLEASIGNTSNWTMGSLAGWVDRFLLPVLRKWSATAVPQYYGLCGGMAAAALDYFLVDGKLPRGKDYNDVPTNDTPEGSAVRQYLMQRQLESMALNFPKLLLWMGIQHVDLPFIQGDGPPWLRHQSFDEWNELKGYLDRGSPWPIMLIGTSTSPFHNHQVLAYGYNDPDNGTGTLFIYDMNCPDQENTIKLDFRQSVLVAEESCADPNRGPLRGFFCNSYTRATPPTIKDER